MYLYSIQGLTDNSGVIHSF